MAARLQFGIKVERKRLDALIAAGRDPRPALELAARHGLRRMSEAVVAEVSGRTLQRRSGRLARAWTVGDGARETVTVTGRGSVTSHLRPDPDVPYASVHQDGATIVPRRARVLTVPLPDARAAGLESAREVAGGFWITVRNRPFLVSREGKQLTWWFIGLDRVRLPKRQFLTRAREAARPEILTGFRDLYLSHLRVRGGAAG